MKKRFIYGIAVIANTVKRLDCGHFTEVQNRGSLLAAGSCSEESGEAACMGSCPFRNGEPHLLLHRFAVHDLGGIIMFESERIRAARTFVGNGLDFMKKRSSHERALSEKVRDGNTIINS
jgi:hypothetical protein